MALENDKIKDLFHSKLSDFETDVPASVWSGIGLLLPQQPAIAPNTPDPASAAASSSSSTASASTGTAVKASIIKTIAVAAGIAIAVTMGILLIPDEDTQVEDANPVVLAEEVKESRDSMPDVTEHTTAPEKIYARAAATPTPTAANNIPLEMNVEQKETPAPKEEEKAPSVTVKQAGTLPEPASIPDEIPVSKKKGLSLGMGGNFALMAENSTNKSSSVLFSEDIRSEIFKSLLEKEDTKYYLHHSQPISLGLTVSKQLTPRLSIQTGLVYTYLSSRITATSALALEETQHFDYLGIPLNLNYTFLQSGKTKFYISIGGLIQKDIKGVYKSYMHFDKPDIANLDMTDIFYSEPYFVRNKISQSNPQFSAHTTIGVLYPLYRRIGIFGAFGGAYYFDAGNEHRTIYSDRKIQLDLNIGVNFNF